MQVADIFQSVCLTVIGSIIIALAIHKMDETVYKRRFFKALYHEIEWNLYRIKKLSDRRKNETTRNKITPPELPLLLISSYQTARLAGELLTLREEIRDELDEVYEFIDGHNRIVLICESVPTEDFFWDRIKKMEEKLQHLENELPRFLKYLKKNEEQIGFPL